jgi:hypothetical protein
LVAARRGEGVDWLSLATSVLQIAGATPRAVLFAGMASSALMAWKEWPSRPWALAAAILFGIAWLATAFWRRNLVRNARFVRGPHLWGTGHLEDRVRNGNYAAEVDRLPYLVAPNPSETDSRGRPDPQTSRSRRGASFLFDHRAPRADKHWGSLAQRLTNLRPHARYTLTFWAKGASREPSAFFATADLKWENHCMIDSSDDWTAYKLPFSTGDLDYTEIRFVIQAPGKFWITEVRVTEPAWRRG